MPTNRPPRRIAGAISAAGVLFSLIAGGGLAAASTARPAAGEVVGALTGGACPENYCGANHNQVVL